MLAGVTEDKEHAMSQKLDTSPDVIGIDIGKNSFHIVGQNQRGAIVLRQKWSRGQMPPKADNPRLDPNFLGDRPGAAPVRRQQNYQCPLQIALQRHR
jgi:hypothetical protein